MTIVGICVSPSGYLSKSPRHSGDWESPFPDPLRQRYRTRRHAYNYLSRSAGGGRRGYVLERMSLLLIIKIVLLVTGGELRVFLFVYASAQARSASPIFFLCFGQYWEKCRAMAHSPSLGTDGDRQRRHDTGVSSCALVFFFKKKTPLFPFLVYF